MNRPRRGPDRTIWIFCSVTLGFACSVRMYPGPERPRNETALVEGAGEEIQSIDRMDLPLGSKFFVLGGPHLLTTKKRDTMGLLPALTFCFDAEGGRSYSVQARTGDDELPKVFDLREDEVVSTYRPTASRTCVRPGTRPPVASPLATASTPPQITENTVGPDASTPTESPDGATVSPTEVIPAKAPAAAPATRALPAVDNDAPRPVPRRAPLGRRDEPQPSWFRHPGNGLTFELGAFFGGEDLITAQLSDGSTMTLSAGQGIAFSIGGMWTPLWIGDSDSVGFGVGVSAGWKYDSIDASNASVSFSRYPVGASLHALLRLDDQLLFLVKAGIQKELDIGISGSGDANQLNGSLDGGLGVLGEVGFYYVFQAGNDHLATALSFRYTAVHDSVAGASIPASNFGVVLSLFYNP